MTLREFITNTKSLGFLVEIDKPVDPRLEMAPVIAALDGRPVLFNNVAGSEFRVLSGQCSDRRYFALALGCEVDELVFRLADAYAAPQTPPLVAGSDAPCQQVVMSPPDLRRIPFLTHYADDAGPYATAAIAVVNDPDSGPNVSFHRCLRLDSDSPRRADRRAARHRQRAQEDAGRPAGRHLHRPAAARAAGRQHGARRPASTSWRSPTRWLPRRWSGA